MGGNKVFPTPKFSRFSHTNRKKNSVTTPSQDKYLNLKS